MDPSNKTIHRARGIEGTHLSLLQIKIASQETSLQRGRDKMYSSRLDRGGDMSLWKEERTHPRACIHLPENLFTFSAESGTTGDFGDYILRFITSIASRLDIVLNTYGHIFSPVHSLRKTKQMKLLILCTEFKSKRSNNSTTALNVRRSAPLARQG